MKAMLWKEFRENFKWAVLAMIGLGLAEFYGLNQPDQFGGEYDYATICKSSFLMATTFGCAAVGLVLGLVQILPEQRRDQWAALIHRPVERAVIFRGKAVAGFLLYLLATVPPFLACVWYVATPGHFASPFVPRMVYPGAADICGGAMYYFGALFVALHRGPWYGRRVLGLLAAFYTSVFLSADAGSTVFLEVYGLPFYVAVEAAVLMALALFTAGWGFMCGNGTLRAQPWLGRLATVAVAFYGVCGVGKFILILIAQMTPQTPYYESQYFVDVTGRVVKQVYSKDNIPSYYDLAGNPINDPNLTRNNYTYRLARSMLSFSIGADQTTLLRRIFFGAPQYRSIGTYVGRLEQTPAESWFYLPQQHVLVGYRNHSRAEIGTLGLDGFRTPDQPAEPLPAPLAGSFSGSRFCRVGDMAYYLDYDQHEMTPVFSEPGQKLYGVGGLQSYQRDNDVTDLAVLALAHEARLIDRSGKTLATLPYHEDTSRNGTLYFSMMADRNHFFLWYTPNFLLSNEEREKVPTYLEEMDAQGKLLVSYTLPPFPPERDRPPWWAFIPANTHAPIYAYGEILYDKIGALAGVKHLQRKIDKITGHDWPRNRALLLRNTAISFVLALITLFWARSAWFSWRRAWLWALFVLGLNIPGLIVFRLCADWPVRVKCPACGRPRPVDFEKCPACGAGWPEPPREGIEIFTPVESAPVADAVPSA